MIIKIQRLFIEISHNAKVISECVGGKIKLTSISPWIWVVCCLLIISTVGLLYFVLNYEIEKNF